MVAEKTVRNFRGLLYFAAPYMLVVFFLILSKTVLDCCPQDSFSSMTMYQRTELVLSKIGSRQTVRPSLPKISGLQIRQTGLPYLGQY